jgi:excisionase family DNA binding protein
LISSNDLADRLGVSRATVLRAVAKGQLRPAVITPGGHRRFRPQDVEELSGHLNGNGHGRQLISSSEAARLLGVSQQTLNRAVRDGRVRPAAVTPGGHRRFDTSEIIAGREQGGGQNA